MQVGNFSHILLALEITIKQTASEKEGLIVAFEIG
jgi:hypothetical protein